MKCNYKERMERLAKRIRQSVRGYPRERVENAEHIATLYETGEYDLDLAQSYHRLFDDPRLHSNAITATAEVIERVGESGLPNGDDILQAIINRAHVVRPEDGFVTWSDEDDRLLTKGG